MSPPAASEEPLLWFYAAGVPIPQGSKTAFAQKEKGGDKVTVRLVEGGNLATKRKPRDRLKNWRGEVGRAAKRARVNAGLEVLDCGLVMGFVFVMPRPVSAIAKSTRRLPKDEQRLVKWALDAPSVKPDLSKLIRAVEDGLEGVLFSNDSRIVGYRHAFKIYDDEHEPGVFVEMWQAE